MPRRPRIIKARAGLCRPCPSSPTPGSSSPTWARPGCGSYLYDPTGSGWTFAGTAGIAANGTDFTAATPRPGGGQVAFLQRQGSFSQIVDGWAAGTYQLSFQAAQRAGNNRTSRCWSTTPSSAPSHPPAAPDLPGYRLSDPGFQRRGRVPHHHFPGPGRRQRRQHRIHRCRLGGQATLDTVGDAGFEQPNVGPAGTCGSFKYNPAGTPWTFVGNSGIAANGSGFTSSNPDAPEGGQVAFLQETGSFSQTVNGWAAGTYQISFQAAQRAGQQPGLPGADRQRRRRHLHADRQQLPDLHDRGLPRRGRVPHHHLQGPGRRRRRQHRIHRRHLGEPGGRAGRRRRRVRAAQCGPGRGFFSFTCPPTGSTPWTFTS